MARQELHGGTTKIMCVWSRDLHGVARAITCMLICGRRSRNCATQDGEQDCGYGVVDTVGSGAAHDKFRSVWQGMTCGVLKICACRCCRYFRIVPTEAILINQRRDPRSETCTHIMMGAALACENVRASLSRKRI